ncbi:MAG: CRISPR-associated CARF protein Csx1 [Candidatus Micrarchaeaceae archaeon]
MKILISVWGQPEYWKKVKYNFESDGRSLKDIESCTTLKILSESYDKTILVASESIFDFEPKKEDNDCVSCMNKLNWKVPVDDYKKMIDAIENNIRNVLECLKISGDIHIVVLPAVGRPGPNVQFSGKMDNFTSIGLLKMYDIIRNLENIDEIAVDVTHGINYMSALIFVISRFLAQIAYLRHNVDSNWRGVKMTVLNADPISIDSNKVGTLSINKIMEEDVRSIDINSMKAELPKDLSIKQHDDELKQLKEEYHKIFNVIVALYNPFPLALSLIYSSINTIPSSLIKNTIKLWESRSVTREEKIEHNLEIYPLFAQHLILSDAVSLILGSTLRSSGWIRISDLEKISDSIYKKISVLSNALIKQELSLMRLKLNKITGEHYLSEFYHYFGAPTDGSIINSSKQDKRAVNKRIMIAHAGFQSNLTKVKVEDELYLSYGEDVEEILNNFRG